MSDALRACVIGAGPAGDAVSRILTRADIDHDVFDENPRTGGNIDRIPMEAPATALEARGVGKTTRLMLGTDVIDLTKGRMVRWFADEAIQERTYDAVFVCTGGYDGALPRRWARAARVTTVGALHALLKAQALVPDGDVVLIGAGPFLWVAAADLRASGAAVRAVIDRVSIRSYLALGPFVMLMPRRTARFLWGAARVILSGTKVRFGRQADITRSHRVRVGREEFPADHVAITDLFAPQTQLPRSASCTQTYSRRGRYFYTATDRDGRTSVDGIYVCGEGQGIHGREFAEVTGELAARAFVRSVGRRVRGGRSLPIRRNLLGWYAAVLESAMYGRPGRGLTLVPEAEACSCEHVPVAQVEEAIGLGLRDLTSIKAVTRCGMGACQGRYCEPIITRLLERSGAEPLEPFFQKGFVRPVMVSAVIEAER
jgi:NADPH-dependent 2,4-dienoyl-CoA reductase/sulfur reductase-like enzyme